MTDRPYVLCSAWTPSYADLGALLREDCERLGLPLWSREYADRGSWEANCAAKPDHILDCMEEHPGKAVVWVDADARVRREPVLFDELTRFSVEVAVRRFQWSPRHKVETLSGTVFFGAHPNAFRLAGVWRALCAAAPATWDQVHLGTVLDECELYPLDSHLPPEYCWILPPPGGHPNLDPDDSRAVITHAQASRERKR